MINIVKPDDRIGVPYIPCDPKKIIAIVPCNIPDKPAKLAAVDDEFKAMSAHMIDFLHAEVKAGRMPKNLLPLQSGVGSVANAVIQGLCHSDFKDMTVYTEVIQEGIFDLFDAGKLNFASGTSMTLSKEGLQRFYDNIEEYRKKIILRPLEISNNPEVIRRLGVIAMNTAIEFDIYGNVNSTHVLGTKIMNGIGGSGDFARNAYLTFFFTKSTAKTGVCQEFCVNFLEIFVIFFHQWAQPFIDEQLVPDHCPIGQAVCIPFLVEFQDAKVEDFKNSIFIRK